METENFVPEQCSPVPDYEIRHVFIIGSKSLGRYGGFETFTYNLIRQHKDESLIKYHVACKANGSGYMDESTLSGVTDISEHGNVTEFTYNNAHVFKIPVPKIGPAAAIYYDIAALKYCLDYCRDNNISRPVFYILACRIGPFLTGYAAGIKKIGGELLVNPDGHEWKRAKWSPPVRKYWKKSEELMVKQADLLVCDSINIEEYIKTEYAKYAPRTTYIAYGADSTASTLDDDDPAFTDWLKEKDLKIGEYYLVVGRFVPENNYETMIREFMKSHTHKDLAIITDSNDRLLADLEKKLEWMSDPRIKFVGTVYKPDLLKKIREEAYAYLHGHEVGGTNPSLLEALGSTDLNLLLDVGFNREVGRDAALYWNKSEGVLAGLIDEADTFPLEKIKSYAVRAKEIIRDCYSWEFIGEEYKKLWLEE